MEPSSIAHGTASSHDKLLRLGDKAGAWGGSRAQRLLREARNCAGIESWIWGDSALQMSSRQSTTGQDGRPNPTLGTQYVAQHVMLSRNKRRQKDQASLSRVAPSFGKLSW